MLTKQFATTRATARQSAIKSSLLLLIVTTILVHGLLDSLETILDQWGHLNPRGSFERRPKYPPDLLDINAKNEATNPWRIDNHPQPAAGLANGEANHISASDTGKPDQEEPSLSSLARRYIHLGRGVMFILGRAQAIRLLRFDAPKSIQEGQPIRLRCLYEVGRGDRLQSLALYKNGREFYRYQPFERRQPVLAFNLTGINIDMSKSKNSTVVLVNTTIETSGRYRCEATSTSFQEVNMETFINVMTHRLTNFKPLNTTAANSRGIRTNYSLVPQIAASLILHLLWMFHSR